MSVSARSAHARSAARSALRRVAAPYGVAKTRLRRPIYVENGPLRGLGGRATRAARACLNEISMRHVLRTCVSDTLIGAHFRNAEATDPSRMKVGIE